MPTYEYACTHCGHAFEFFQKITDKPLENCPKCNNKVKRLISGGSGIIFSRTHYQRTESGSRYSHWKNAISGKGSGFYATDYRKKPKSEVPQAKADTCPEMKKGCDACKPK